jgi:thiamine kinase-like enzyme
MEIAQGTPEALGVVVEPDAGFAGELPGFADLQRDIERLLGLLRPSADLSADRIQSLEARLRALGESVFEARLPAQPLHGDASLTNLLRTPSGRLVWNDFEDTCRGPLHWDVAGYVISLESNGADPAFVDRALSAYGWTDRGALTPFTAAHDVYGEIWRAFDAQRRL